VRPNWRVRVTNRADLDLAEITRWTVENFGGVQAVRYAEPSI
jgi:plasmid stabilization system protein ParE